MRRKSEKIIRFCVVCGDKAKGMNFNALTCQSCKAFFRRNALSNKELKCSFENRCHIDKITRKFCSSCRLQKCFINGMKKEYILTDEEKRLVREKILQNRHRREQQLKRMNDSSYNNHSNRSSSAISITSPFNDDDDDDDDDDVVVDNNVINASVTSSILKPYSYNSLMDCDRGLVDQFYTSPTKRFSPVSNSDHTTDYMMSPCSSTSIFPEPEQPMYMAHLHLHDTIDVNIPYVGPSFDSHDLDENVKNLQTLNIQQTSFKNGTGNIINLDMNYQQTPLNFVAEKIDDVPRNVTENRSIPLNSMKMEEENCDDCLRYHLQKSNDLDDESTIEAINEFQVRFDMNIFHSNDYDLMFSENDKLLLKELCTACTWLHNPYKRMLIIRNQHYLNDSPHDCTLVDSYLYRIIRVSKRLTPFTSLHLDDQVQLLTFGMIEIIGLYSMLCFDPEFQGWSFIDDHHKMTIKVNMDCVTPCCIKYDYKTSVKNFYNTFKYEWKTDYIIINLLTATILFTERPGIRDSAKIRERKNLYIQLLKHYLNLKYTDKTDAIWAFDRMFLTVKAMQMVQTDLTLHLVASTAGKKFSPLLGQLMAQHISQQLWHEDDKKHDCNINRLANRSRIIWLNKSENTETDPIRTAESNTFSFS
ncbi:uncharacterized protein LOC113797384 [Dermatophagoides pteronyssinus]|uniref:uncharacterized protein LOC113797384 n=1 Tax=Dermatophagoides pteronyssinus TaxID=6956 RepID=UPI003F672260